MLPPKKVGILSVKSRNPKRRSEEKPTNEIKIAAPMLDAIEIEGRTITADALLTQQELARYKVVGVLEMMKKLMMNTRVVFDFLKISRNACPLSEG